MKSKIIKIICIVVLLLSVVTYFGVDCYLDKKLEEKEQELKETIELYGIAEKESVGSIIDKFNNNVIDNSELITAKEEYLTIENNQYWYTLKDGIFLFIVPVEYTGDKNVDIAKKAIIYFDKKNNNVDDALVYAKFLISSNNDKLAQDEINKLLDDSHNLSNEEKAVPSGNGITFGIYEDESIIEYQVNRIYE